MNLTYHAKESGLYSKGSGELGKIWGQERLGQLYILEKQLQLAIGYRNTEKDCQNKPGKR